MFERVLGIFFIGLAIYVMGGLSLTSDNFVAPVSAEAREIKQVMTVKQAYDAIPHLQVTFNPNLATSMSKEEAQYLYHFFWLVDLAVIERVQTQKYMSGYKGGADNKNHTEIIRQMQVLLPPDKLKDAHQLVLSAIDDQRQVFDAWRGNPNFGDIRTNPMVKGASAKLIKAYNLYMSLYPNESAHNKNSFFQHLCALDFI